MEQQLAEKVQELQRVISRKNKVFMRNAGRDKIWI